VKIESQEEGHLYRLNDNPVPGVTSVISGLGLIDTSWFTDEHRFRGKAVHAAVHYWLEGDLDWKSLSPALVGYVEGAIRLIETVKLEGLHIEARVGSETYGFCGTADFVGTILGEPVVLDWKSGPVRETTGMQLSGYEIALREEPGAPDRFRRIGVQLRSDGTFPKPVNFTSSKDERRFLAALDLYRAFVWPKEKKYGIDSRTVAA
jgi:hypothetical protein